MSRGFLAIAPSDRSEDQNRLREPLQPIAAWQLADHHFAFDSSAILPSMTGDLAQLIALTRALPNAPLAVFGHADPTGEEGYNKQLSGRRALALYGLLTGDPAAWKHLADHPIGNDDWGKRGANDALREFLAGRGQAGASGLKGTALYQAYLDAVAVDESGAAFRLERDRFLGKGRDAKGKVDYQGCGEANPLVVFSASESAAFAAPANHGQRNEENGPNRRVTVFLFPPGTEVDPAKWPCPRAGEGVTGCRKRFWSDAKTRAAPGAARRVHPDAMDTFACRFYDRLGPDAVPNTRRPLLVQLHDPALDPVPNTEVEVSAGGSTMKAMTDQRGWLRCQVPATATVVQVAYRAASTGVAYRIEVQLPPLDQSADRYRAHVANFGYQAPGAPPRQSVLKFQAAEGLPLSGEIDEATRKAVDRRLAAALKDEGDAGGG
ncbi:MAG: OmpA family protein [Gemmatimonadales bacterium]